MAYIIGGPIWPEIVVYENDKVHVDYQLNEHHDPQTDVFTVLTLFSGKLVVHNDELGVFTVEYGDIVPEGFFTK